MSKNQELSWSEKRAIYLAQAQDESQTAPFQDQIATLDSSQQPPVVPPRLQGADDPDFLNKEMSKQGDSGGVLIPPRRGSSNSATSSVDDPKDSAAFSKKNLVLQAVSNGHSSSGIASKSSLNSQVSDHPNRSLKVPSAALTTPLPTSSGRSSSAASAESRAPSPSSPSPSPSSNTTPTIGSSALPPFSSATTSNPYLNARSQAVGQNSGTRSERAGSAGANSIGISSSVGLAKYLAQQPQNSMSSPNPHLLNLQVNQSASSSSSASRGQTNHSSNYASSLRSANSASIGSSPTRIESSTNPLPSSVQSESSDQKNLARELALPPPKKKEKKTSSFLMDNDFHLGPPSISSSKEKEKKSKRAKAPENLDTRKGGVGIESEQNWNQAPHQASGGVVNALGHFGGIVGRRGWEFVRGLNGPSSPSMSSPVPSPNNHTGPDSTSNSQQRQSHQQSKHSSSRSQSPLPPPPSHPHRGIQGKVGDSSTIGHASSQSLSLGQMSGVAFNALRRGAGAAANAAGGGSEAFRASQDLSRNSASGSQSFELNDATRKWLNAPEPGVGATGMSSNGLAGRNAATTGRARGKHSISSNQAVASVASASDARGVFGMELREAVLRTRLVRPLLSNSDDGSSDQNIQNLDLDLGNEFRLSDSDVLKISSSSNPNSRRSSTNQAPSPNPKPKRLSSNKIKRSSQERLPYSREEARIKCLPCVVTRCIESLERFGTTEEGIYRLSGRTSHTLKLRSIFDAPISASNTASHSSSSLNKSQFTKIKGKANSSSTPQRSSSSVILPDLELSEIGPAELDLNSVCSVLKQYLRDLPEPLLGKDLVKDFDEKCHLVTGRPSSGGALGMGLVGSNQVSTQSKNPAPKAIASGSGGGHSESKEEDAETQAANQITKLADEIEPLMARIPCQNWYLLREIALHLTDLTSEDVVRVTKMPLSNLCLVLAPTLSMSGVLLRALVIHHQRLFRSPPPEDEAIDVAIPDCNSTPSKATLSLDPTSVDDRRGSTMTLRPRSNTQPASNSNHQFTFGLSSGLGSGVGGPQIISGSGSSSPSGVVIPANSGFDNSSRSTSPWTLASAPSSSQEDLASKSSGEPRIARKFIKSGGLMNTSSSSLSSNQSDGNASGSTFSHSDQSHQSLTNSTSNSNSISIDHKGNLLADDEASSISTSSSQREKPFISKPTKPQVSALDRPRPPTRSSGFYSSFANPVVPTRPRKRNNATDSEPQSPASSPTISSGFNAGITLLSNSSSSAESPKLDLDFQSMRIDAAEIVKKSDGEDEETPLAFEERRKMWESR